MANDKRCASATQVERAELLQSGRANIAWFWFHGTGAHSSRGSERNRANWF